MKEIKGIRNLQKTGKSLGYYKAAHAANARSSENVKPVEKVKLSQFHDSHAGIEQAKMAYSRLRDVSEEYRTFFKNEQAFESAYDEMDDSDDFVGTLIHFISIYNESLQALIEFDRYFKTDYHTHIFHLCHEVQNELSNIGIRLEPDGIMRVNRHRLENMFAHHPEAFSFFVSMNGLSFQLIDRFKHVKSRIMDNDDVRFPEDGIHGLLIDKKC